MSGPRGRCGFEDRRQCICHPHLCRQGRAPDDFQELKAALVLPLPAGSQLVAILDTRHSGSLLDLNHYRCNRVFVPWIRRGRRRSEEFPHEASRWKVRAWRRNSEELHRKLTLSHSPTPSESESESEFPSTSLLPDVQRSESPVGMFSCNGWCRDSEEVAVPVERADVISLACHDPGPWWDGYVGMTSSLVKILRRKPNQSLKELLLSVSHHMHMIPEGLVDSFDSFRNPELSSSRPLDMERSTKSFFGRGHTVGLPPDTRAEVHTADGEDLSALQAACTQGHLDTVRLLLEQGGANEVDEEYGSALQAASMNGHTDIVELLLENGVSVNAGRGEFASALQAAAAQGNIHVVSLLLGHGADVNISGGMFGGALQAASVRDHVDTARFLLDNGANVDAVGGKYGNALKAAHKKGYTDVVRLLLERGANTVQESFATYSISFVNPWSSRTTSSCSL
ncbi:ankyrin repeat-containing domain protein [Mycena albidolilacea]|uniref:Ankyrin repeat-containing domain protein n=1 Tax=Mycena albidolilacea TaxID=1033008 RepID=A0AAD7ERL1_9AGAR|nr:ankyrin repeat-containing domain protein [Mycena albidolilacea]